MSAIKLLLSHDPWRVLRKICLYCPCPNIFQLYPVLFNTLNAELYPICYLLALLGAHHFLRVSRIRVKSLTLRLLMSYMLIKVQLDATVCSHLFTATSLYMFRVSSHPSSGVLKTVSATSGISHGNATVTSFHRGLIRIRPRCIELDLY